MRAYGLINISWNDLGVGIDSPTVFGWSGAPIAPLGSAARRRAFSRTTSRGELQLGHSTPYPSLRDYYDL